ncbi:flavin mononucleotide phosphatase [Serratia fonticola]|uniref:Flavin mononucleotide phosphatase n=1 Tax=Serratia fonticola TaxID=47917 RepID=A0A3S4XUU1_SERFO|nr:flavin mononucleotide phosphatase [Serratia fonticola]
MHFYRPLRPLAALTFDLDDTLYDNRPVIKQTEHESVAFLQNYHPGLSHFQSADFHRLRQELREQDPEIYHDVTQWRWRAVHLALSRQGLRDAEASIGADAAMQNFALWRSRIDVPEATHATLRALGNVIRWWRSPMAMPIRPSAGWSNTSSLCCAPGQMAAPSRIRICINWRSKGWAWRQNKSCTSGMT